MPEGRIVFARLCCLVGTLAALSLGGSALAENDERVAVAARLFEEARALIARQEYPAACKKLEESDLLDPQLGTQLHLASCYEREGKIASAWRKFRTAAELAAARNRAGTAEPREQVARKRIAALEARLSNVRVAVTEPNAEGLSVQLDGRTIEREAWGVAKPTDPGPHRVLASAPGRLSWSRDFDIRADKEQIDVTVPRLESAAAIARVAASAAPEPPPVASPSTSGVDEALPSEPTSSGDILRISGYIAAGLGVVSAGLGLAFAVDVSSANDSLERMCVAGTHADACENREELDRYERMRRSAERSQTLQTVFLVAGGALIAGGIAVVILAPRSEHAPTLALQLSPQPTGLVLHGTLF